MSGEPHGRTGSPSENDEGLESAAGLKSGRQIMAFDGDEARDQRIREKPVRSSERPRQENVASASQPGAGKTPDTPVGGSSTRSGSAELGNATGADAPGNAIVPGNAVGVCGLAVDAVAIRSSNVAPKAAGPFIASPSIPLYAPSDGGSMIRFHSDASRSWWIASLAPR